MEFIGIDAGRKSTKLSTGLSFPSVIGEWRSRNLITEMEYDMEIDGRRYFVGELARESRFRREMATESKIHEETKILFLTAATLAGIGKDTVITTGLPIAQHSPGVKAELTSLLRGRHRVSVNGEAKIIDIQDIGIVPEGAGAYWNEVMGDDGRIQNQWLFGQLARIIDIGSRTVNYCTIQGGKYLDLESGTLPYGMIEVENEVASTAEVCNAFARKIAADLSRVWPNYRPSKDTVLLAGGGAIAIGPYLKKHSPLSYTVDDPVFANVKGYRKMGMVRCLSHR